MGKVIVGASIVVLQQGEWNGEKILNGKRIDKISAILDEGENWNTAKIIAQNREINFQGSVLAGKGFVLSKKEAEEYRNRRPENAVVIFPFLSGEEVNTSPTFTAKRFAIDFRNFPLEYCEEKYPELLDRIRRLVKPLRDKANRKTHKKFWWQHGDKRPALYSKIRNKEFVFVTTRHTKVFGVGASFNAAGFSGIALCSRSAGLVSVCGNSIDNSRNLGASRQFNTRQRFTLHTVGLF